MQKVDVALVEGPDGLSASSKLRLLGDPIALSRLHWRVWTSPDAHLVWREAMASARHTAVVVATPPHRQARADLRSPANV
jgi:membrane glycosyltransferase